MDALEAAWRAKEIEREAADVRKGMRWIDGERGEDREELSVEEGIHRSPLGLGQ